MHLVCFAATVLFCAKDFNAAFRIRGCILRSANPEPDLENMFCTREIAEIAETKPKSTMCPVWSVVNLEKEYSRLSRSCSKHANKVASLLARLLRKDSRAGGLASE
jgi:hypothetical protein